MQNQNETIRINRFLNFTLPLIVDIANAALQSSGLGAIKEGNGLDTAFRIKSGEKEVKFFMHNLLLEITTIDRDEENLRFDERLRDFDYFLDKTIRLTHSKLKVLFHLFTEEDIAIDDIIQDAKEYERIRIWRFDQKPT